MVILAIAFLVDKCIKNHYNESMEDKDSKYYETLCNNHNQIIHNLQTLKKSIKDPELREIINDTLDFSRHCKKQGQRMENRMKKYRQSIESCGFQRVNGKF